MDEFSARKFDGYEAQLRDKNYNFEGESHQQEVEAIREMKEHRSHNPQQNEKKEQFIIF